MFRPTLLCCSSALLAACGRIAFDPLGDAAPAMSVGVLDPMFGAGGTTIVDGGVGFEAFEVAHRGTGYVTLGTHHTTAAYMGLAAFTHDGGIDASWGTNGILDVGATANDFGYSMVGFPDRVVIGGDGYFGTNQDQVEVAMIDLTTGQPVSSFGVSGYTSFGYPNEYDTSYGLRPSTNGLMVCGTAGYDVQGKSRVLIAELSLTGGVLNLFTDDLSAGDDYCTDLVPLANGVIAVGQHNNTNTGYAVKYTSSGTRDASFATGGVLDLVGPATTVITLDNGTYAIVGVHGNQGVVVIIDANGAVLADRRETFADDVEINAAVDVPGASYFLAGGTLLHGTERNGFVARYHSDGSLDTSFGTAGIAEIDAGGDEDVKGLLVDTDGSIVAAGVSQSAGTNRVLIARLR